MPNFFPIQTSELKFEEPKAFRRFSFSLVEMALVTGVLLRVYRYDSHGGGGLGFSHWLEPR